MGARPLAVAEELVSRGRRNRPSSPAGNTQRVTRSGHRSSPKQRVHEPRERRSPHARGAGPLTCASTRRNGPERAEPCAPMPLAHARLGDAHRRSRGGRWASSSPRRPRVALATECGVWRAPASSRSMVPMPREAGARSEPLWAAGEPVWLPCVRPYPACACASSTWIYPILMVRPQVMLNFFSRDYICPNHVICHRRDECQMVIIWAIRAAKVQALASWRLRFSGRPLLRPGRASSVLSSAETGMVRCAAFDLPGEPGPSVRPTPEPSTWAHRDALK